MGGPQRRRSVGTGDAEDTEWISRKLVSFGRYKDGRPRGLRVESDSTFLLEDLMDEWGYDEGLSKDDVMQAVRHHMFHGNDPSSTLRFAIESTGKGAVVIRVMPKSSRGGGGGGRQRGREKGGMPWHNGGGGRKRERSASPPSAIKTEQKLSMGLDELIAGDKHRGKRHKSPLQPFAKRRRQFSPERFNYSSYNNNNDGEVGGGYYAHSDNKKDDRQASPPQQRRILRSSHVKDSKSNGEQSEDESLSRWVSWLLKIGYRDYNVRSDDGWSPLDEVAAAIRRKHEGYEDFTKQEFEEFLHQNNDEGRFQISRGWLRKVPRAIRD